MATNAIVVVGEGPGALDHALKKLKRELGKGDVTASIKRHTAYRKPSVARVEKQIRARRRARKLDAAKNGR